MTAVAVQTAEFVPLFNDFHSNNTNVYIKFVSPNTKGVL